MKILPFCNCIFQQNSKYQSVLFIEILTKISIPLSFLISVVLIALFFPYNILFHVLYDQLRTVTFFSGICMFMPKFIYILYTYIFNFVFFIYNLKLFSYFFFHISWIFMAVFALIIFFFIFLFPFLEINNKHKT